MPNANVFDEDLEKVVVELQATLDLVPESSTPFDSVRLTRAEQLQRFQAMGPDQWRELLSEKPWDEVLKYATTMQRRQESE